MPDRVPQPPEAILQPIRHDRRRPEGTLASHRPARDTAYAQPLRARGGLGRRGSRPRARRAADSRRGAAPVMFPRCVQYERRTIDRR